jgi:hypothetical protein
MMERRPFSLTSVAVEEEEGREAYTIKTVQ